MKASNAINVAGLVFGAVILINAFSSTAVAAGCECAESQLGYFVSENNCEAQKLPACDQSGDCDCIDTSPGEEDDDDGDNFSGEPPVNPNESRINISYWAVCDSENAWMNDVSSGGYNYNAKNGTLMCQPEESRWYCTKPGTALWTTDLDINGSFYDACAKYGYTWTGNYCCGEADEVNETYNDFRDGKLGKHACLRGNPVYNGTTIQDGTLLVHRGQFYGCNASGEIAEDYESAPNKTLRTDESGTGNLTESLDWCASRGEYYCSEGNGNWTLLTDAVEGQCAKVNMEKTGIGACADQSKCYHSQSEGCVESGYNESDKYCDDNNCDNYCQDGNWTTRTGLLAEALRNVSQDRDANHHRLRCDAKSETLVDESMAGPGDGYCALWYQTDTGNYTVIGASVNGDISNYVEQINRSYFAAMNITGEDIDLSNTDCSGKQDYQRCSNTDGLPLHYDNTTRTVMFSTQENAISPGFTNSILSTIRSLIDTILGNTEQSVSDTQGGLRDFNRLYLEQNGSATIRVVKEEVFNSGVTETYVTARYPDGQTAQEIASVTGAERNGNVTTKEDPTDTDWELFTEARLS